jgi:hypothetical protein
MPRSRPGPKTGRKRERSPASPLSMGNDVRYTDRAPTNTDALTAWEAEPARAAAVSADAQGKPG